MKTTQINRKSNGFTLIELLVTISIIAILSSMVVIGYTNLIKKAAISNDKVLVNQVNNLLLAHRVEYDLTEDKEISDALKDAFNNSNVDVKSKEYDMNVYYNHLSRQFELIEENNSIYTLEYYLTHNFDEAETPNVPSPEQPGVDEEDIANPDDPITYTLQDEYSVNLGKSSFGDLKAYVNNKVLYITILIDANYKLKNYSIDLSNIITATDNLGNNLDVIYECKAIDLVNYKANNVINDYTIDNNSQLTVNTPGFYQITCICQDEKYTIDLYVKNICLPNDSSITFNKTYEYTYSYTINEDGTYNIKIETPILIESMSIYEYEDIEGNQYIYTISNNRDYMNNMVILIDINGINGEEYVFQMNSTDKKYTLPLSSVIFDDNSTLSIQYRYQAKNGLYCYSDSQTIEIK